MNYSAANPLDVTGDFRHIMSLAPTPVTIVTASTMDGPQGIVIGSFVSVSLEPPLIGLFLGKDTRMWQPMTDAAAYCVNILAEDQASLSKVFVTHGIDRFAEVEWEPAANGAPTISGAIAWIEAKPFSVTDAGDHDLVLLEVTALRQGRDSGPLVYQLGQYSSVAHSD